MQKVKPRLYAHYRSKTAIEYQIASTFASYIILDNAYIIGEIYILIRL